MLPWSGKSKATKADALPMRTITHASLVHLVHTPSPVPDQQNFTFGTNEPGDPPPPSHESSEESMTPKPKIPTPEKYPSNPTPRNNPPNLVPNIPAKPGSDTSLSYSPLMNSSYSSYDEYSKQIQHTKIIKRDTGVKRVSITPSKIAQKLQRSYLQLHINQRS